MLSTIFIAVVAFCWISMICVLALCLIVQMIREVTKRHTPPVKQPQRIETTAQRLAFVRTRLEADARLEAELRKQLERERGSEGGFRGVPAEVLSDREAEAEVVDEAVDGAAAKAKRTIVMFR